uniref:Uncharacterized protein n=1 Tax=Brassica oleracea var. oleracea TaxID=109376 RepID=A0A0D3E5L3_BRAOL
MAALTNPSILKIIIWACHSYHYNIILYKITSDITLFRPITVQQNFKLTVSSLGLGSMQIYPQ